MIYGGMTRIAILGVAITFVCGCAAHGGGVYGPARDHRPYSGAMIPEGHMPPPGECRIWYDDLPPGQQPPPGKCRDLERRVPLGAILVRG